MHFLLRSWADVQGNKSAEEVARRLEAGDNDSRYPTWGYLVLLWPPARDWCWSTTYFTSLEPQEFGPQNSYDAHWYIYTYGAFDDEANFFFFLLFSLFFFPLFVCYLSNFVSQRFFFSSFNHAEGIYFFISLRNRGEKTGFRVRINFFSRIVGFRTELFVKNEKKT